MKKITIFSIVLSVLSIALGAFAGYKAFKVENLNMAIVAGLGLAALLFVILLIAAKKNNAVLTVPVGIAVLTSAVYARKTTMQLQTASLTFYIVLVALLFVAIVYANKYKWAAITVVVVLGLFVFNPFMVIADSVLDKTDKNVCNFLLATTFIGTYVSFMLHFAGSIGAQPEAVEEISE